MQEMAIAGKQLHRDDPLVLGDGHLDELLDVGNLARGSNMNDRQGEDRIRRSTFRVQPLSRQVGGRWEIMVLPLGSTRVDPGNKGSDIALAESGNFKTSEVDGSGNLTDHTPEYIAHLKAAIVSLDELIRD